MVFMDWVLELGLVKVELALLVVDFSSALILDLSTETFSSSLSVPAFLRALISSSSRRGNSGASWDPSAQKDFEWAKGFDPGLPHLSRNQKNTCI